MTKFVAHCPIKNCDFEKKSDWKNVARGGVILHILKEGGDGHGSQGSRPEKKLKIKVEEKD